MIDKKDFLENLELTQNYCESQMKNNSKNFASILRSINPIIENKEIFSFYLETFEGTKIQELFLTNWNIELFERYDLFDELFEKQIKHKKENIICSGKEIKGRIFISEFECTVVDGASEAESKGIVDIYDLPPIDTWFYKSKDNLLYSWIPEDFENLANNAIEVNCVDILKWMDSKEHFHDFIEIFGDSKLKSNFNNLKTERIALPEFLRKIKVKYKLY